MSESSEIPLTVLCQQIVEEGHTPSVARLRAKAPYKVSVTDAISAIKSFNTTKQTSRPASLPASQASLEKRVQELENAVALLEKRLDSLMSD
ncbi:hypothetical protein HHX48_06665 [Salinimonas sp. HHU 13199]|uniref:KfrA N-terminal DNA-binding domain-containing protein n=1 Tax=Salinimonas profundi TaxID=2729140 RepID=A0ABR8LGM6_9ALTE|nr:hypothetical protein [Salinimonas profundi]MBD3585408.1 hypothetical protein [Salinimonas profundi]